MAALEGFTNNIPELHLVRHENVVLSGLAAESIIQAAGERGIDLLVMGSRGRSGVKKLALGSVAEKVVRNIRCPVLVTGPGCASHYEDVRSVLLAVDSPLHSLRAAQYAVAIARQSGATLTVAHIYPAVQPEDIDSSMINRTLRELHSLVPGQLDLAKTVQFRTAKEGISEEILNIASECKAGIIVTSPKNHTPLADHAIGSVLSALISKSHCPILTVLSHF